MSSFTDKLIVTPMPDGRRWKLEYEFDYHLGKADSPYFIHVPAGFITDFASVPPALYWLFPPWGKYGAAAIVHDFIYQSKILDREMADLIFKEAMCVLGVPAWKRNLMWAGVRLFGWLGYAKNNLPSA
jgi:hypothetical protein